MVIITLGIYAYDAKQTTQRCQEKKTKSSGFLTELHLALFALALLEGLVQEGASLLVTPVDLETLKEHLFVLAASAL